MDRDTPCWSTGRSLGYMASYRLLTTRPAAEAHVLLGALRAEGLDAQLERDGLGAIYGLTSGAFATRVLIAMRRFRRGRGAAT